MLQDLACLNRDLSKVIIIDCDSKSFALQPQNAFLLKKWNGEDDDRTLIDLAAFLQSIVYLVYFNVSFYKINFLEWGIWFEGIVLFQTVCFVFSKCANFHGTEMLCQSRISECEINYGES